MSSTTDKIAGKAKQAVGKAVGDDKMRAKGPAQEVKGKVQTAKGNAKEAVKSATDRL